jgi:hypothetical protein
MRKTIVAILCAAILLAVVFAAPKQTSAAHDDFAITYTVSPNPVGYLGADIQIVIDVENKGATPITWIEVDVLTLAGFKERRNITIAPGTTRYGISFTIPFAPEDLGRDKLL